MQLASQKVEELFKPWERIDILVGEEGREGRYESRIEDFINGGIVIQPPVFLSGDTRLRDNMSVIVRFTRADASYQFQSRIRTRQLRGERQMVLSPPGRIQRVQRRLFVRVELGTPVEYVKISAGAGLDEWEDNSRWDRTRCVNISGGGALITVVSEFEKGDCLLLRMEFLCACDLPSPIVAIVRRKDVDKERNCLGVEFVLSDNLRDHFKQDIINQFPTTARQFDSARREDLVSAIFSEQIELRKKGLL